MICNRPDHNVPGLICGHPLPCPYHTTIIERGVVVPRVSIPLTEVPRIHPKTLKRLKRIAKAVFEK